MYLDALLSEDRTLYSCHVRPWSDALKFSFVPLLLFTRMRVHKLDIGQTISMVAEL